MPTGMDLQKVDFAEKIWYLQKSKSLIRKDSYKDSYKAWGFTFAQFFDHKIIAN